MSDEDIAYLEGWVSERAGVEGYVEPETFVNQLTVVLVAKDGEWTRRRVGTAKTARKLGQRLSVPMYDVQKTGYPQRMRDHNERQRILERRERARRDQQSR
ncbi:oxidoreductase [Hoyosella sp. YIM 151337]|nr:oxidoreductase [Hoyosella sp. YIM 151337]MCW4355365.1 oxidoreductase [Hoyosella sp. YIM 151337]